MAVDQTPSPPRDELGFERIVFFSDAVMAIAITLMALEIRLPDLEGLTAAQVQTAMLGLIPHIFIYILSFVVIGMYWMLHHRLFRDIHIYGVRMMWFNLFFLMCIAFVPVATNALGTYDDFSLVTAFYAISIALVSISYWFLWWYVTRRNYGDYLDDAPHMRLYVSMRILLPSIVFLGSLLLVSRNSHLAELSWLLLFPLYYVTSLVFPKERALRARYDMGQR